MKASDRQSFGHLFLPKICAGSEGSHRLLVTLCPRKMPVQEVPCADHPVSIPLRISVRVGRLPVLFDGQSCDIRMFQFS